MKGICFIPPLHEKTVQKIKRQTRRIMTVQPANDDMMAHICYNGDKYIGWQFITAPPIGKVEKSELFKPRYNIGEVLYLKEPYRFAPDVDFIIYKFDYPNGRYEYPRCDKDNTPVKWKNKLFMPASVARYFIKITNLRAERLQKISYEDCIKEGIFQHISHAKVYWKNGFDGLMYDSPRDAYAALINKINGKDTWESNPFVWVYDYELTDKEGKL